MEISGSIYIILTALCWSFGGVFLKFVTGNVIAVAGIRSLSGLIALMLITRRLPSLRVKNDDGTTSKDSKYLWLCAFCSAATMILFVIANRLTTAANAIHHKKRNARHPLLNFLILAGIINCSLPAIFYPMGLKTVSALSAMLISLLEPLMNPIWVLIFYGEISSILCIIGGVMIIFFVIIREILHKNQFKNG